MEVYNETKKLINKISDDVVLMRISSNHKHDEEYEQGLDALTIDYQMLQTKKTEISNELERLFFEDESKFDRAISLWFKELDFNIMYVMTINQQIPSNFIIDSFARYRSWNSMEKRLKSGDRKLTIDMDIFLSYFHWILHDIRESIEHYNADLKKRSKHFGFNGDHKEKITQEKTPFKKTPTPKIIYTYDWKGKQQGKTDLHKSMKGNFIDKSVTSKVFCEIFEKKDTQNIKRVVWIKNPIDLLYFIYKMMDLGLIVNEIERMNFLRLKLCFCKVDGKDFNENFRTLFYQLKSGIIPPKEEIDKIINSIK